MPSWLSLQAPGRRTTGSRRPSPSDTSRATSATLEPVSDKNNDTLQLDFVNLCSNGGHTLLAGLFAAEAGAKKANSFNSVSRRFINQLNELMVDLNATKVRTECHQHLHHNPWALTARLTDSHPGGGPPSSLSQQAHFIRCIKPNTSLKAFSFTPSLVLTQLRCSGTIDAVQLMAGAYPTRKCTSRSTAVKRRDARVRKLEPPLFCEALARPRDPEQWHGSDARRSSSRLVRVRCSEELA